MQFISGAEESGYMEIPKWNHSCHMELLNNMELNEDMLGYLIQEHVLSSYDIQRIRATLNIPYRANILLLRLMRQKPEIACTDILLTVL